MYLGVVIGAASAFHMRHAPRLDSLSLSLSLSLSSVSNDDRAIAMDNGKREQWLIQRVKEHTDEFWYIHEIRNRTIREKNFCPSE